MQKGICVSRWLFTKNHYMIHRQQNVKKKVVKVFLLYSSVLTGHSININCSKKTVILGLKT